jgi:hypothetical protein
MKEMGGGCGNTYQIHSHHQYGFSLSHHTNAQAQSVDHKTLFQDAEE